MGKHVSERDMKCEWDVWECSIEAVSHVIYIPKYETSHHHHPEMVHKGTQRKDKLWSMWRRMNREGQSNRKGGKKGNQSWEPGPHNIAEQAAQWKIQVWNVTIWHGLQLKLNQTELSFLKPSLAQRYTCMVFKVCVCIVQGIYTVIFLNPTGLLSHKNLTSVN